MTSATLWAVTTYFNIDHGIRRLENFHRFRERLTVPLLAIELSFDGVFDLAPRDADLVVQIGGGDVMWQKERLLNLAVPHLPPSCVGVAALDCDILFADCNWPENATAALQTAPVVQLFSTVRYLTREWDGRQKFQTQEHATQYAVSRSIAEGADPAACLNDVSNNGRGRNSTGIAWAYRRDLLERYGMFQWNIIGGGDTAMAAASVGAFEAVERRHQMTAQHRRRYRAWAEPWFAEVQGHVGVLDGDIHHMWHGDMEQRQAHSRHLRLASHGYDPDTDLMARDGCPLQWQSTKPELRQMLIDYFNERTAAK